MTFSREKLSCQSSSILRSWSLIIFTSFSLSFTICSHLIFKSNILLDMSSWDLIFMSTFLNQSSVSSRTCNFNFSIKDSFYLISVSKKYFVSLKAFMSISFCWLSFFSCKFYKLWTSCKCILFSFSNAS